MERRDTQINDKTYSILTPQVKKAMPLCTHTAVLLGPLLGMLGKDVNQNGLEKFATALQSVDPEKVDALFTRAVSISKLCCNNQPISDDIDFERHFSEHRSEVYQVCIWALWSCVKDFFPKLGNLDQKVQDAMDKGFKSQPAGQTTTG